MESQNAHNAILTAISPAGANLSALSRLTGASRVALRKASKLRKEVDMADAKRGWVQRKRSFRSDKYGSLEATSR
eukprot:scaffold878_cov271-Pinguiococcus_pyrenoidosus.AAC.3